MRGTIDQFNFRQLHHQYLLLMDDEDNLNVLRAMSFPHMDSDNALLLYGYIDTTAGVSFEVLSSANVSGDGKIQYRESSKDTVMKIRYDSIHGTLATVPFGDALSPYQWKVDVCNNNYRAEPVVEAFREIEAIDSSRHPQYPDDLIVFFGKDGLRPEGIWCRPSGMKDSHIFGKLLNTPYGQFGVTQGDIVEIVPVKVENEFRLAALLQ